MLGYILPTGDGRRVLWYPSPRLVWGVLKKLGRKVTILTPVLCHSDADSEKVSMLTKDNIHRPTIRHSLSPIWKFYWAGRLMLWGVIWLANIDDLMEDIIGGSYLLLGLPLFHALHRTVFQGFMRGVVSRFIALAYAPDVEFVYSKRLALLERYIDDLGITEALNYLDELGFRHLQEFYRRVAWQERWTTPLPSGAGVINAKTITE